MDEDEIEVKGIGKSVGIGKRRVAKLIHHLNAISKSKYGGVVAFEFASGNPTEQKVHPTENTIEKRLHGGNVGIAIRCAYKSKVAIIHARCAHNVQELAGATLTTEMPKKREGKYGLLAGSLIMSVLLDAHDLPIKYALFTFDDLVKWGCIKQRHDRSTFIRARLNRVSERLIPFIGRDKPIGLFFKDDYLDPIAAMIKFMEK